MLALSVGFFASPPASQVVGIEPLDALAQPVAMEIRRQLMAGGSLRPVWASGDPSTSDCSDKPYAAVALIETTVVRLKEGWSFDAGLVLADCAGWDVEEWHEFATLDHPPAAADAEALGINLLLRLRTWMGMHPARAQTLFAKGFSYDPDRPQPTYLYTLFKSNDGNLRAFVRPGGPAYEAGMRTNDVIVNIDGRPWWQYGTNPAERLAYDGLPHVFDVKRGTTNLRVELGAPFAP